MQSHSIDIEKPPKRIKIIIKFQTLHSKLDGTLELTLKQLILKSPTFLKAVAVMNQILEGYTSRFWKNISRLNYIDVVQSVQIYLVYRYSAASAKHVSFANTAVDSVVNATLNLARHSKTILSRRT